MIDVHTLSQAEANEALSYALEHCHAAAQGNKRRILHFLVPVRMALGMMPSTQLLEEYSLQIYAPFAQVQPAKRQAAAPS